MLLTGNRLYLDWVDVEVHIKSMAGSLRDAGLTKDINIVPLSRGGLIPATILSHFLGKPIVGFVDTKRDSDEVFNHIPLGRHEGEIWLVDEILDTGDTLSKLSENGWPTAQYFIPYAKHAGYNRFEKRLVTQPAYLIKDHIWVVFPWETSFN